ncbi:MAG: hypothetical protein ABIK28_05455 [Planctomycetota bacterium]
MNQGMPMMVPKVGQQQPFDVREAAMKPCAKCQGEFYDKALRLGLISPMAPSNPTRQEVRVEFQVYLCRSCGHEFGKPVPTEQ